MKTYQESHIIAKNELCYDNPNEVGDGMNNKVVGKFIAQTRRKKSLTQAQLGEKLGISDKAISKWERGLSAPDITVLPQLSEALDVSIAEILLGAEINTPITKEKASDITVSGIGLYKKIFRRRYTRIIGIFIAIILLLLVGFSTLYMVTNYNKVQVYGLESRSNDISFEGLIVKNQKENSILIAKIRYERKDKMSEKEPVIDNIVIELKIGKTTLYLKELDYNNMRISEALSTLCISINESKILNEYAIKKLEHSRIYMRIITTDSDYKTEEYYIPIKIQKRFSNNKLVY
ncbi:MAG: helix-turn-helix transcriptional regulator [Bacilli bacterium]|nr:helix-turn-helix transcriptional regulator [Bacilli bacterium]